MDCYNTRYYKRLKDKFRIYDIQMVEELEVNLSDSRQYAFTLRKCTKPQKITAVQYLSHVLTLCENTGSVLISHCFEMTEGLHMHGIIEIPNNTLWKKFRVRGWNIKIDELYYRAGWDFYMMKEQHLKIEFKDANSLENQMPNIHPKP